MSGRTITPDQLPRVTKDILNGRTVLQVVAVTDDHDWASKRTWEFARVAAAGERRVALIDLSLEEPALDAHATKVGDEGIVDAFLYGVSLSHVAQAQDIGGLYYVGVGTRTGDPTEVWSSNRWDRLARGFKNEGAILIAFVPAGALNRCALEADGIIVLAPEGYDPATDVAPGIARKLRAGTPLLGVIVNEVPRPSESVEVPPQRSPRSSSGAWDISGPLDAGAPDERRVGLTPRPHPAGSTEPSAPSLSEAITPVDPMEPVQPAESEAQGAPIGAPSAPAPGRGKNADAGLDDDTEEQNVAQRDVRPRPRPAPTYNARPIFEPTPRRPVGNTLFWIGGALAVAAVAVGFYAWNGRTAAQPDPSPPVAQETDPAPPDPVAAQPPPDPEPEPEVATIPAVTVADADSLFYSIQAAALNTIASAMEHGDEYRESGLGVTVSPVRVLGRTWYRVILGAFATSAAADSALRALWRDGLVENLQGTILRTPQAFDLGSRDSLDSARTEAEALWDRGIPATVLPATGGAILSVGAFERPGQATIAEDLLSTANIQATLGPRMGTTR